MLLYSSTEVSYGVRFGMGSERNGERRSYRITGISYALAASISTSACIGSEVA